MKNIVNTILVAVSLLVSSFACAQDIIITTDAQKIDAKILEVSKHEIRYKEKDNLDGPTFVLETKEINSIIYANGKVTVYNQPASQEPAKQEKEIVKDKKTEETKPEPQGYKDLYVGLPERERTALIKYLDGYPKNIVAIKGDYSMIYDKKCHIYFDFEYDDADLVEYDIEAKECEYSGVFTEYAKDHLLDINKQKIIQSACDLFYSKMIGKKCTFQPIDKLTTTENDYIMRLHIKRIDVGNGTISVMSSGRTTAGGAIIYGNIEILKAATNDLCSILIVDRVQGIGDAYEDMRIQRVFEELISNKMFFIKQYKMYTKDINN